MAVRLYKPCNKLNMKYILAIFLCLPVISSYSQNGSSHVNILLRTGDLLFCSADTGTLSKAIDESTQTGKETHFDHVGIVEINHDTMWVLHAAPKKGVCIEQIGLFLSLGKSTLHATAYRLKMNYQKAICAAIQKAHGFLGQSYNFTYRLNDPGHYCSEYIYEIFAADSVFTLNPMTFKDPKTGQFLPGWIDHYRKLELAVPEGEPGCNPNGLAASDKLEIIGVVKLKN